MSGLKADSLKAKSKSVDAFITGASTHSSGPDPDAKAEKSFTVPVNDYELELLRKVADKNDRSMRKESRRLLVKALLVEMAELE